MVAVSNLGHVAILAGAALLLVPWLGFRGYGWAEVVALPTFVLFAVWFHVYVGRGRYAQSVVWYVAWSLPLFSWQLGFWVWISVLIPLLWSKTRGELSQAVAMILRRRHEP